MKIKFPSFAFVFATTILAVAGLSLPAAAQYQLQSQTVCRMTIQAQRELIIREAAIALDSVGSECFEKFVQSEMQVLRNARTPISYHRRWVIQSMLDSAIRGDIFENESAY